MQTPPSPTNAPSARSAPTSGDAVRRLYEECINGRELDRLSEVIDESYVGPNGERGPTGFAETVSGLTAGFPDIPTTAESQIPR